MATRPLCWILENTQSRRNHLHVIREHYTGKSADKEYLANLQAHGFEIVGEDIPFGAADYATFKVEHEDKVSFFRCMPIYVHPMGAANLSGGDATRDLLAGALYRVNYQYDNARGIVHSLTRGCFVSAPYELAVGDGLTLWAGARPLSLEGTTLHYLIGVHSAKKRTVMNTLSIERLGEICASRRVFRQYRPPHPDAGHPFHDFGNPLLIREDPWQFAHHYAGHASRTNRSVTEAATAQARPTGNPPSGL